MTASFVSRAFLVAACIVLTGSALFATPPDSAFKEGREAVVDFSAYRWCRELASPKFAGRLTGHEGYTAMSRWVAGLYAEWGLKKLNPKDGYLQPFRHPHTVVDETELTVVSSSGSNSTLKPVSDYFPMLFSDSGDRTGELVFVGWGISAPEIGYDDYAGLDVKGKFVVCFRGTPDPADDRYTEHDHHRKRMTTAREKGAVGLLYIYDEPLANPNGDWLSGFLAGIVSEKTADTFLKEKSVESVKLKEDLLRYKKPLSFPLKSAVRFRVQSRHFPESVGYNVCGVVEGSDPALRDEYIIIGAHADHCGKHAGILFPGAQDNASGSAVVIELARVFSGMKSKPRRSIVFVLFGAEEAGLQGSEYFAANLTGIPGKAVGMLNLDMVGTGDKVGCGHSAEPDYLQAILKEADAGIGILAGTRPIRRVGVRSSDFAPFFKKGIPCFSFSSNGPHLAYHQPGDTIFRINPDILGQTARLCFSVTYLLTNR